MSASSRFTLASSKVSPSENTSGNSSKWHPRAKFICRWPAMGTCSVHHYALPPQIALPMKRTARLFVCSLLFLACLLPYHVATAAAVASRPNVIFILSDDLGYGDLGCFGQKLIKTPNIDRLAAEGMRFTQAYAGDTVCAPSRCTLMTGKHTGHSYVRGNKEIEPEGQIPMPADTFTVAHLMKNAGYTTGIIGKWGLGKPDSDSIPTKMGFDYFYGYNCQRKAHEYYPEYLWRNTEKVPLNGKAYSHDLMADEALGFVRTHKDKPFFLYVA